MARVEAARTARAPRPIEASIAAPTLGRALLAVSRWEFMPGGIFFIFASAALASLSWSVLSDHLTLILWGACVWYLSHLIGSHVNCLADVEIDAREKSHLSRAVRRLGGGRLAALIGVEMVAALAVSIHMAAETGRFLLPVLWLLGLGLALAYSVEPVRLKRRGWLNPLCLTLVLYALPMAYGYVALAESADAEAIGVLVATGTQMLALILLNPAEDVETDRTAGIETPCVRHGLAPVAALAALAFVGGTVAVVAFLGQLASGRPSALAGLAVAVLAQLWVSVEIVQLAVRSRRAETAGADGVGELVRRNPLHFAVLGVSLALACGSVLR